MNRHERRAARKRGQNQLVEKYIKHLPEVPVNARYERGKFYHTVYRHDDWCSFYSGTGELCNCNPIITRHVEPRRS